MEYRVEIGTVGQGHYYPHLEDAVQGAVDLCARSEKTVKIELFNHNHRMTIGLAIWNKMGGVVITPPVSFVIRDLERGRMKEY